MHTARYLLLTAALLATSALFGAQKIHDLTITGNTTLSGNITSNATVAGTLNLGSGTVTLPSAAISSESSGILGSEVVSNGNFTTNLTGWSGTGWAYSSGAALHTAGQTAALTQSAATATRGTTYKVSYTVTNASEVGFIYVYFGGVFGPFRASSGTYTDYYTATSTDALSIEVDSAFAGSVDNVSIKSVTTTTALAIDSPTEFRKPLTLHSGVSIPEGAPIRWGYRALENNSRGEYNIPSSNIAIGYQAAQNTTTGHATVTGYQAGYYNTTGVLTAMGKWAGLYNTTGHATFFGNAAGLLNTTSSSVAMGDEAGASTQTANLTAVGYYALNQATAEAVAVGTEAFRAATTGRVTGLGHRVGYFVTTGDLIAIGDKAGYGDTTSNAPVTDTSGILIGQRANRSVASGTQLTNYVAIGADVLIDESNKVILGNGSITKTQLRGNVTGPTSFNTDGASIDANFPLRLYRDTNTQITADLKNENAGSSASAALNIDTNAGTFTVKNHSLAHSVWPGKSLLISGASGSGIALATPASGDTIEFWPAYVKTVELTDAALNLPAASVTLTSTSLGYIEGSEQGSDPAAPASNKARLYVRDNGSGKTQLVVRFPTGAVQVVATEP